MGKTPRGECIIFLKICDGSAEDLLLPVFVGALDWTRHLKRDKKALFRPSVALRPGEEPECAFKPARGPGGEKASEAAAAREGIETPAREEIPFCLASQGHDTGIPPGPIFLGREEEAAASGV